MDRDREFRKRLLATFRAEALEHIATMGAGLSELERLPPIEVQMEIVETVFREAHSLKGAARAVNLQAVESVCQALESVFAQWKMRRVNQSRELFDALYLAVDTIRAATSSDDAEGEGSSAPQVSALVAELERLSSGGTPVMALDAEREAASGAGEAQAPRPRAAALEDGPQSQPILTSRGQESVETVRVSARRLGSLLRQAEEMLSFKAEACESAKESAGLLSMAEALRAGIEGAGRGAGPEEAAGLQRKARVLEARVREFAKSSRRHSATLGRMIDGLLEDTKQTMLLPFAHALEAFPMLVREISRKKGKEAALVMAGESLEIDRRVLEEIKDPLMHLVRNCVDHGIERPSEREAAGKPRKGTIKVSVTHADGNTAEVRVDDDGGGIDAVRVRAAAVKMGILKGDEAEDDEDALSLVFSSGLSTSPIITDLSGRGLGLAIVREKVEGIGGSVEVSTSPAGTSFRLLLPLTVATFRGVRVGASGQSFIIPVSGVERTLRLGKGLFSKAENMDAVIVDGEPHSFAHLSAVLGLPGRERTGEFVSALVLSASGKKIVFGVDEVFGEEDVLARGLGPQLRKVRNVSGAAILGNGRPVPILNVPDLLRSAVRAGAAQAPAMAVARTDAKKRTVLVAEDSITSRMLLKNILETAGYEVRVAVDGVDAWTLAKTERFDIIVSDVEMPRMSGFELAARVRADRELSEVPVVLVTALETREDRERGIEAGANAYMIKSSFNQNNLLEIIRRLTA